MSCLVSTENVVVSAAKTTTSTKGGPPLGHDDHDETLYLRSSSPKGTAAATTTSKQQGHRHLQLPPGADPFIGYIFQMVRSVVTAWGNDTKSYPISMATNVY